MPKYTYKCKECNKDCQLHLSKYAKTYPCPTCNSNMSLQMPSIIGQEVTEVIDPMMGTKWKKDQKDIIQERKEDHYWKHEVPKLVNSGVYSMQTMLENGWVYIDDKGKMQVNTIPPAKR